ncbi:hypothetical protein [Microbulbifer sp. PSTR4-B]|uniref:hypothetical protein n=1 Tax=unclassified Microbulbifer TaxID=2619833 RepID=UPI00403B05C1
MVFLVCESARSVLAFKTRGEAARHLLTQNGQEVQPGADPVRQAQPLLDQGRAMLNLSDMFDAIAESDDQAAQELAAQCRDAVDNLYQAGGRGR